MSRAVSTAFKAAAFAQETGEVVASLLTITHEDTEEVLRISSDPTERVEGSGEGQPVYGTISRGETFLYIPFSLRLPNDQDESNASAEVVIENIGLELVRLVRSVSTPAQITIEVILPKTDPDEVEVTFPTLEVIESRYDAGNVVLGLSPDDLADEPFPADSFDPSGWAGLFA